MSTQQPPGGGQDGGSGYTPPQDPWSGFEPGLASMPTDPIPQQHESYPTGPTVSAGNWAPAAPPGPPPQFPMPPAKKSRAGVVSIVVILVLLLGGGGGYVVYRYLKEPAKPTGSTTLPTAATTTVFPYTVEVGDCLVNVGSKNAPVMAPADCSTPGSYKVIKIARGADIPLGPSDKFDANTTSAQVCKGTGYQSWYGYQMADARDNLFFCMTNN